MLDAYGHVNNAWYVRLAQEHVPEDFCVRRLRAEYKNAAHLGDLLHPLVSATEEKIVVSLSDLRGTPYAVIEFCR
jgi:acyl-CoA thioesterase FadM